MATPTDDIKQLTRPQRRLPGWAKWLLVACISLAVGFIALFVGSSWWLRWRTTTDADQVAAIGDSILTWSIAERFEGIEAADAWFVRWSAFQSPYDEIAIWGDSPLLSPKAVGQRLRDKLQSGVGGKRIEETEISETETLPYDVKGQEVWMTAYYSKGKKSGNRYYEFSGFFPGNERSVFVYVRLRDRFGLVADPGLEKVNMVESVR